VDDVEVRLFIFYNIDILAVVILHSPAYHLVYCHVAYYQSKNLSVGYECACI